MSAENFFKVPGSSTPNEVNARLDEYARIQRARANSELPPEAEEELLEDREDEEVEATPDELSRAERVAARNQFILSVRDSPTLTTYAQQSEAIRQYDREHPL